MERIAELDIPSIYKGFGRRIESDYSIHDFYRIYQYYCAECGSYFTAKRLGKRNLYGVPDFGENKVTCPCCGNSYATNTKIQDLYYFGSYAKSQPDSDNGVISCNMRLYEAENTIKLKLTYDTMIFSDNNVKREKVTEELLFNVKDWNTRFRMIIGQTETMHMMLGNPLNRYFLERTFIADISNRNGAVNQGKEICAFLKFLRNRIQKKFKKINGFELKSPYVSYGNTFGRMAYPLFNLAYRLAFPDAKNLKVKFANNTNYDYSFMSLYGVSKTDENIWQEVVEQKEKDRFTALRKMYNLPNTTHVRRLMHENIFDCINYSRARKLCLNQDICMSIFKKIKQMKSLGMDMYFAKSRSTKGLYKELALFAEHFNGNQILTLLSLKEGWSYIMDILGMFIQLSIESRQQASKIKIKKLHQWLSDEIYRMKNADYSLNVPDYIKKRLEMQKDRIKFFMPDTFYKLKDAGKALHNCVGSYGKKCANGQANIVLMADDIGRLIACIEIQGTRIVQAKLNNNVPACLNMEVNYAIVEWSKKTGLMIETRDIKSIEKNDVKYIEA